MSAVISTPAPVRARSRALQRKRRASDDWLRRLPVVVPLLALGLCSVTALIWSAVLFAA